MQTYPNNPSQQEQPEDQAQSQAQPQPQQVLLSVIIPVYGVEKYIERCARSLFEQTLMTGIEFIFVNDCTPDNSIDILEKTLKQYPNRTDQVKIIHLEKNGGSANARHVALKQASGIYICNCDSDDWAEPDMYKTLLDYALAHDSDMVWCDFYKSTADGTNTYDHQTLSTDKYTLLGASITGNGTGFVGALWNRIYKKSLYTSDFVYPQHDMNEDILTVLQLILNSRTIHYIPKALYHYFLSDTSICRTTQPEKIVKGCLGAVANTNVMLEIFEKHGLSKRYEKEIVAKKLMVKDYLWSLCDIKQYRHLWRTIYPEVHTKIWNNPYDSLKGKMSRFCMAYRCYPYWLKKIVHIHAPLIRLSIVQIILFSAFGLN